MSKHHNYTKYANKNDEAVQPVESAVEPVEVTETPEVVSTVAPVAPVAHVEPVVETATCEQCGETYNVSESHECAVQPNHGSIAKGTVVNCTKLNVRVKPSTSAAPITILPVNTKLNIDIEESTDEWYKIYTATGVKGYCMKQFIDTVL